MLLKWIACYPALGRYEPYITEQRVWNRETFQQERADSSVMAGGPAKIVLLIEWPDQAAVDRFMAGTHEALMQQHDLGPYLRSYAVAYFEHVENVGYPPEWSILRPGEAVVRHTLCTVPPEAFAEFLAVQQAVWSPGMQAAPGFAGGRIWRQRADPARVLLTSYFIRADAHRAYRETQLPLLRQQGSRSLELSTAISGEELPILERWHRDDA